MRLPPSSLLFFASFLVLYAAGSKDRVAAAGNDASRFAHVEALVEHGRSTLERSRHRHTVDKVIVDGAEYSNKPPLLALAGAAVHAVLRAAFGWSLADPRTAPQVIYWVTVLLVGLPSALLVLLFERELARASRVPAFARWMLTLALGAGTLLYSFAVTFNNHSVAAALLFAAFVASRRGHGATSGFLIGVTTAIDVLPGLGFAPCLAVLVAREGRRLTRYLLGLAGGFTLLVVANLLTIGSVVFPKMVAGAVDLSTQAGSSAFGVVLPDSWTYPIECLVGPHGLFVVSPVLVFGLIGIVRRRRAALERREAVVIAIGIALQIAGHVAIAGSFGGWSYGYRYLLPIQPLLLFLAADALDRRLLPAFTVVLPISVLFAALGAYHPWPPAFEQKETTLPVAARVTNPIGGNAAAWLDEHAPGSTLANAVERWFIKGDAKGRREYLEFFHSSRDYDAWLEATTRTR